MGFGKSKSTPAPAAPAPVMTQQPVENRPIDRTVNPGALERTAEAPNAASLLAQQEEEKKRLMSGGSYGMG